MKKVRLFLDWRYQNTRTIHVNNYLKDISNKAYELVMFLFKEILLEFGYLTYR